MAEWKIGSRGREYRYESQTQGSKRRGSDVWLDDWWGILVQMVRWKMGVVLRDNVAGSPICGESAQTSSILAPKGYFAVHSPRSNSQSTQVVSICLDFPPHPHNSMPSLCLLTSIPLTPPYKLNKSSRNLHCSPRKQRKHISRQESTRLTQITEMQGFERGTSAVCAAHWMVVRSF